MPSMFSVKITCVNRGKKHRKKKKKKVVAINESARGTANSKSTWTAMHSIAVRTSKPHTETLPSFFSAAKAWAVDATTTTFPDSDSGAVTSSVMSVPPPLLLLPQATTVPSDVTAANADSVEATDATDFVLLGATAGFFTQPHDARLPSPRMAANASDDGTIDLTFLQRNTRIYIYIYIYIYVYIYL